MELMKPQVKSHFLLGSGADCSPLSAGVPNISSNTAQPDDWRRFHAVVTLRRGPVAACTHGAATASYARPV